MRRNLISSPDCRSGSKDSLDTKRRWRRSGQSCWCVSTSPEAGPDGAAWRRARGPGRGLWLLPQGPPPQNLTANGAGFLPSVDLHRGYTTDRGTERQKMLDGNVFLLHPGEAMVPPSHRKRGDRAHKHTNTLNFAHYKKNSG